MARNAIKRTRGAKIARDDNGAPRLDRVPRAEAAHALGISGAELDRLEAMGFELYNALSGCNAELLTPEEFAAEENISTRQLRRLEARGLPSTGTGRRKRYPYPLAAEWLAVYRYRAEPMRGFAGRAVEYLDPVQAAAEMDDATALLRAYWHARNENECSTPRRRLDPRAVARLDEARELVRAGRYPDVPSWS